MKNLLGSLCFLSEFNLKRKSRFTFMRLISILKYLSQIALISILKKIKMNTTY